MLLASEATNLQAVTPPYFLEQVNHEGIVIARHAFDQLPIKIGRAYHNDLILDDPFVAAAHVEIKLDNAGDLSVYDLNSENGVTFNQKKQPVFQPGDQAWQIGKTRLQLRHAGSSVAPALFIESRLANGFKWPWVMVCFLMLALSGLYSSWVSTTGPLNKVSMMTDMLSLLVTVSIWAAAWALLTKVMGKQVGAFSRHLVIVTGALIGLELWTQITQLFAYVFSLPVLTMFNDYVLIIGLAVMAGWHLKVIHSPLTIRSKTILTTLATVTLTIVLLNNLQDYDQFSDQQYLSTMYPPSIRLTGNQSIDDFINGTKPLKAKLDKSRQEPLDASLY